MLNQSGQEIPIVVQENTKGLLPAKLDHQRAHKIQSSNHPNVPSYHVPPYQNVCKSYLRVMSLILVMIGYVSHSMTLACLLNLPMGLSEPRVPQNPMVFQRFIIIFHGSNWLTTSSIRPKHQCTFQRRFQPERIHDTDLKVGYPGRR